jgi:hypothetical protein
VDFIADNAVAISAIILGVLVLGSLGVLALRGLRFWRLVKRTRTTVMRHADALTAETDRLTAALEAMPRRQAELQGSLASLQRRAAVLGVLASHAAQAAQALRAPLRYIGR